MIGGRGYENESYATMYTAGGSAGPPLFPADEKVSTGCGVRYADRHAK